MLSKVHKELAAVDEVHDKTQRWPRLECVVKLDDKRVVDYLENSTLLLRAHHLPLTYLVTYCSLLTVSPTALEMLYLMAKERGVEVG